MTKNQEPGQRVSRLDIESVSRKLAVLAADLPESERAVLGLVLSRAQAAPPDVDLSAAVEEPTRQPRAGAVFERPFAGQLARAAGLFDKPEVTVVVGWQYSFSVDRPGELIDPADLNRDIGEGPA